MGNYRPKRGDKVFANNTAALSVLTQHNPNFTRYMDAPFEFEIYSVNGPQLILRGLETGFIAFYPHEQLEWLEIIEYLSSAKIWREVNE